MPMGAWLILMASAGAQRAACATCPFWFWAWACTCDCFARWTDKRRQDCDCVLPVGMDVSRTNQYGTTECHGWMNCLAVVVKSYKHLKCSLTAPRRARTSSGFFFFVSFYSASCLGLGDLVQRCLGQPVDLPAPWPWAAVIPRRWSTAVHFQSVERRIQRNLEELANVRLDELTVMRRHWLFFFFNAYAEKERTRREGRHVSQWLHPLRCMQKRDSVSVPRSASRKTERPFQAQSVAHRTD